ncbi:hypothetical protein ACFQ0M_02825 [Kitasatospora aburaviensis]
MAKFLDLARTSTTWNDLGIDPGRINNDNVVAAYTSPYCDSNSAETYVSQVAFTRHGDRALDDESAAAVGEAVKPLLEAQGRPASDRFDSFVNGEDAAPTPVVYEHQYLAYQLRHKAAKGGPDTTRVLLYPDSTFLTEPRIIALKPRPTNWPTSSSPTPSCANGRPSSASTWGRTPTARTRSGRSWRPRTCPYPPRPTGPARSCPRPRSWRPSSRPSPAAGASSPDRPCDKEATAMSKLWFDEWWLPLSAWAAAVASLVFLVVYCSLELRAQRITGLDLTQGICVYLDDCTITDSYQMGRHSAALVQAVEHQTNGSYTVSAATPDGTLGFEKTRGNS